MENKVQQPFPNKTWNLAPKNKAKILYLMRERMKQGWPVVVQELHRTVNTQNNFIQKKHSLMKRPNATAPLQEIISFSSWARLKNLMPLFLLGKISHIFYSDRTLARRYWYFFHWVTCQCLPEVKVFPRLFHTGFLKHHFLGNS